MPFLNEPQARLWVACHKLGMLTEEMVKAIETLHELDMRTRRPIPPSLFVASHFLQRCFANRRQEINPEAKASLDATGPAISNAIRDGNIQGGFDENELRRQWPTLNSVEPLSQPKRKGGRPKGGPKLQPTINALKKLYPDGEPVPVIREAMRQAVEKELGYGISVETLDAGRRALGWLSPRGKK
ncbi:MAG TPA: hypothetical protein VME69_15880 [Methylocella sp.]|nr:hypothetical protein [Methylocella sp.]